MNNLLSFWLAPVTAFFHRPVYENAVKSSAWRGVLYGLYLSVLLVVLAMTVVSVRVMPQADVLAAWVKTNMPELIWTPDGLSLENGQTTATLVHPQYGTIAAFDMTKTTVKEADMGQAFILVTSKKVFIKRSPGQIEERDITGGALRPEQQLPPRVRINGDVAMKMYQNLKGAMMVVVPLVTFGFSFVSFLVANLFYSLAGLLFNLMRQEKLRYGAVFNVTCFATTAAFVLTGLMAVTPLKAWHWPLSVSILINLVFMFFVFKITDQKKEAV